MTHRTTAPVSFTTAQGRKLVAEFSAGHLTSDTRLVPLREADRSIGLVADLDAAIVRFARRQRPIRPGPHLRRISRVGTELEKAEAGTICLRLFRVAGLVATSARRLVVRLARGYVKRCHNQRAHCNSERRKQSGEKESSCPRDLVAVP